MEIMDVVTLAVLYFVNGVAAGVILVLGYFEYRERKQYGEKRDKYAYYRTAHEANEWYRAQGR